MVEQEQQVMSASFAQFEKDFIHANTWPQLKDGVPTYLLDQLSPDEKGIAEDRLIELLGEKNSWPALGLGHLRAEKALPALYALLEKCKQTMVIFSSLFHLSDQQGCAHDRRSAGRTPKDHRRIRFGRRSLLSGPVRRSEDQSCPKKIPQ